MSLLNCFYFKTEGLEYCLVLVCYKPTILINRLWPFVALVDIGDLWPFPICMTMVPEERPGRIPLKATSFGILQPLLHRLNLHVKFYHHRKKFQTLRPHNNFTLLYTRLWRTREFYHLRKINQTLQLHSNFTLLYTRLWRTRQFYPLRKIFQTLQRHSNFTLLYTRMWRTRQFHHLRKIFQTLQPHSNFTLLYTRLWRTREFYRLRKIFQTL